VRLIAGAKEDVLGFISFLKRLIVLAKVHVRKFTWLFWRGSS
jgi:hypothetical protein